MRRVRKTRRLTMAEICALAGAALVLAGQAMAAGLHISHAHDTGRAMAGAARLEDAVREFALERAAMPQDLNRDGVADTAEIVAQLKDWGLLPQDYSPLDPWGRRYVIVLRRDCEVLSAGGFDIGSPLVSDQADGEALLFANAAAGGESLSGESS